MIKIPFHSYNSTPETAKQKTAKKLPRQRKTAKRNNLETRQKRKNILRNKFNGN